MKIGLYLDDVSLNVLQKGVFVSCEPKERIEQIAPGLIEQRLAEIGDTYLVCNMDNEQRGKAKLVEAFTTKFGTPHPRLLELIGMADTDAFKKQYGSFYNRQFPDSFLADETELFVTVYEPVIDS